MPLIIASAIDPAPINDIFMQMPPFKQKTPSSVKDERACSAVPPLLQESILHLIWLTVFIRFGFAKQLTGRFGRAADGGVFQPENPALLHHARLTGPGHSRSLIKMVLLIMKKNRGVVKGGSANFQIKNPCPAILKWY
ncbi:MAG: hypothetical protein LKH78_01925 [Weizmannia coagulans]|jgi:hypothetical protein|nr:hypothetical protein [Heyndrickxia coagulans]